jgi:hypothetical protein
MAAHRGTAPKDALLAIAVTFSLVAAIFMTSVPSGADARSRRDQLLAKVEQSPITRWMSGPARRAVDALAGVKTEPGGTGDTSAPARVASRGPISSIAPNVRVNDPSGDGVGNPDMTTQSEASVAVSGKNVVVGYNDDGKSPLFFQPTVDLSGYSYSRDGGKTFKDSRLPNREPGFNIGDPVLASDRTGTFYYGTLDLDFSSPLLAVAVGRSETGGRTFHTPTIVSRGTGITATQQQFSFVTTDKPWLAVGPNPRHPSHDVIYASWTEDYFTDSRRGFAEGSRIMLASSPDGGVTWSRPHAVFDDLISRRDENRGTYHFVNGSNITVDRTGRVYVGWERFADNGSGTFNTRQEWLSRSTDAGGTFSAPTLFATPSPVGTLSAPLSCPNVLQFGPGNYVRTQEFPMLGIGPGGDLYIAYNSGDGPGRSSIRVARSDDRGKSWFTKTVQTGATAFMPALAANSSGVDVIYYERATKFSMKTTIARSSDGFIYSKHNLSDATFRMAQTLPPFDPSVAPCYMGDYLGATRRGTDTYTAWGDNRDHVTNQFWPKGRPDPNVYFARVE